MFKDIRFGRRTQLIVDLCTRSNYMTSPIKSRDWMIVKNGVILSLFHYKTEITLINTATKKLLRVGGGSASDINGINTFLDYFEVDLSIYVRSVKGVATIEQKK